MIDSVGIGNKQVGPGYPCFIIAEAGVNHNGDVSLAHELVDRAVDAGADAVKFQHFVTEDLVTRNVPKAAYQVEATGESDGQYEMLKALELSVDQHAELRLHCERAGVIYLCTPYGDAGVDMLDDMGVDALKIASTDTNNIPLLRRVAGTGRPTILSTGMSTLGEVERAVDTLRAGGLEGKIILLHCTSEYPAPASEANLRAMLTMQKAFCCPVGFSDHTEGVATSTWAVALGACLIEKHFTLDRNMPGPDHSASTDPSEFADLVQAVRKVEEALGDGAKRVMPSELKNKPLMQKSLVARRDIRAGQTIGSDDLVCKRPGHGLSPSWFDCVVGRRAVVDIPADRFITLSNLDWSES